MKMSFVHTHGTAWYSGAIRWASKGEYNHSLVAFALDDGSKVYFESYWKEDSVTKKTGWRGPIDWERLEEWLEEDSRHRLVEQELPYGDVALTAAFQYCKDMVPLITYPKRQLFHNLKSMMFGSGIAIAKITPAMWTCSEGVGRVWAHVDAKAALKYLNLGNMLFDMIAPSGAKFGLKEAVDQFISDERVWRTVVGNESGEEKEEES